MTDLAQAIGLLSWNAVLFLLLGRWSVMRGPRYRMGDQIVDDITEVLDRRQVVGDNEGGMTIVSTRRWYAFGYDWEISVVQQRPSKNGDRYDSRAQSSTLPQG